MVLGLTARSWLRCSITCGWGTRWWHPIQRLHPGPRQLVPAARHPQPRTRKPRPFGFGLLGHVDPFATSLVGGHPAAPYTKDPRQWPNLPWYDRRTGQSIPTTNAAALGDDPQRLADTLAADTVPLRTIGRYSTPTATGRNANPSAPTAPPPDPAPAASCADDRSALPRPSPRSSAKKATTSSNAPPAKSPTPPTTAPLSRTPTPTLAGNSSFPSSPPSATPTVPDIAGQVGVSDRQVRNWLTAQDQPHTGATRHRQKAEQLAVDWATQQLQANGIKVPGRSFRDAIHRYADAFR